MASAEFRVLGGVEARVDGQRLELHARQRAVLAILLVAAGRTVTVEDLVDRLWDHAPPRTARETVYSYLSRLRHRLGGAAPITHTGGGYLLQVEPAAVDMLQFQALVTGARAAGGAEESLHLWNRALALWHGEPFRDLDLACLNQVRDELTNQHLAAFLDRNDLWLRLGGHDRLLPELASAVASHPLDERLAGQLMRALSRAGRQAEALAHYTEVRQRLVAQLGCEPGTDLQRLHRELLREHDPAEIPQAPPVREVREVPEKPSNLPLGVPGLVGRARELAALDRLLAARAPVVAVTGVGGVGKTALAVHWAHRVRDQFPDGQLYLDLHGFDPAGPALPGADALRLLLELLGVPADQIPTSTEARVARYRSRLAGARIVVVLDNARDAAQVRPLLPGPADSMVLVTSRTSLSGLVAAEGARPVPLELLDADAARQLLASRLGAGRVAAEPAAVAGILAACGGLPLALAIAAARAAGRPTFPLAALAGDLADARGRLDALSTEDATTDIRAVFTASSRALRPDAARCFRLLGLHPGPDIGLDAVASLAAVPLPRARTSLSELVSAHLVAEPAPGRYALHDLVHAHAAELAQAVDPEPDRRSAMDRMFDHYVRAAHHAARLLNPHRTVIGPVPPPGALSTREEASAWLAAEQPVLVALIGQAAGTGLDLPAWQLAWAVAEFLDRRGQWHHLLATQQDALAAASRLADHRMIAAAHRSLGLTQRKLGYYAAARAHLRHALDLSEELGDPAGQAAAHQSLGMTYEGQGQYAQALAHARRAVELFRAAGNHTGEASALNGVGWLHAHLGDYRRTLTYCHRALAVHRRSGSRGGEADAWDSLGLAHRYLGRPRKAIACFERAVERFHAVGDRLMEAASRSRLGDAYEAAGDQVQARAAWRRALDILDEINHPDADEVRKKLG